ncbi:MAG: spore maturation protein [Eubacteriales bacterium]|jgi:spore maturation protein B
MDWISWVSAAILPVSMVGILLHGWWKGLPIFDVFVEGAAEGLTLAARIFPSLVALLVTIDMFQLSGALDVLTSGLQPLAERFGFPVEVLPLTLLRPISGSGSLALVSDLLHRSGPDSFAGLCASVMMGSTETTFYTIAIYYGSVGVKRIRHTALAALSADLCGFLVSVWLVRLLLT